MEDYRGGSCLHPASFDFTFLLRLMRLPDGVLCAGVCHEVRRGQAQRLLRKARATNWVQSVAFGQSWFPAKWQPASPCDTLFGASKASAVVAKLAEIGKYIIVQ